MKVETGTGLLLIAVVASALAGGCAGSTGSVGGAAGVIGVVDQIDQADTATIVGRLVSLRDGTPVAGIRVVVGSVAVTTDTQGTFTATAEPGGEYWLTTDDSRWGITGGPILVEVAPGINDVGQIVVDSIGSAPPAAPAF